MPVGGTVGYELLDDASPFTTSDFLANVNLRRAVEGELARTIGTLRSVRSARVHIVEPERSLFGRAEVAPTASIVLTLRGAEALDKRQIAGIRHLVAAAVPGLTADAVTLVDGAGNLLADARGAGCRPARTRATPRTTGWRSRTGCAARSSSCWSARSVPARSTPRSVPTSTSTRSRPRPRPTTRRARSCAARRPPRRSATSRRTKPADQVGAAGNLPTERAAAQAARRAAARRATRPRRRSTTRSRAPCATRPSAAPRCAGCRSRSRSTASTSAQPDGSTSYEPRGAEELEQLAALVRSAAGVDESRGDVVEVVSRPFATARARRSRRPRLAGSAMLAGDYGRFARARRAQPAHPAGPVLRRAARRCDACSPPSSRRPRPARRRWSLVPTASRCSCTAPPVPRSASTGPAIRWWSARPMAAEPRARRLGPGDAGIKGGELIDLKHVRGPVQASLLGEVARAIEANPGGRRPRRPRLAARGLGVAA